MKKAQALNLSSKFLIIGTIAPWLPICGARSFRVAQARKAFARGAYCCFQNTIPKNKPTMLKGINNSFSCIFSHKNQE